MMRRWGPTGSVCFLGTSSGARSWSLGEKWGHEGLGYGFVSGWLKSSGIKDYWVQKTKELGDQGIG